MGATFGKPKRISVSVDGQTWHDIDAQVVIPTHWNLNPGLLSMRLPMLFASHWARGRRIDGKRAGRRTVENSIPIVDYPSVRHKYGYSN